MNDRKTYVGDGVLDAPTDAAAYRKIVRYYGTADLLTTALCGGMHPQGVCRIRKAPSSLTAALRASRPAQEPTLSAKYDPLCLGADAHIGPCRQWRFGE